MSIVKFKVEIDEAQLKDAESLLKGYNIYPHTCEEIVKNLIEFHEIRVESVKEERQAKKTTYSSRR
jgi:hypothetical protein